MPLLCRTSLVVLCSSMVVCFRARTSPWSILQMSWISLSPHLSHSGTSSRLQHLTHLSVNELSVFWTTSWWTWRGPLSYQKVYQGDSSSKDLRSAPSNVHVFHFSSRHVIFAPSSVDSYASATFPGLSDAIFSALHPAPSVPPDWDEVRRQSDAVRVHIRYATQVMNQPGIEFLIWHKVHLKGITWFNMKTVRANRNEHNVWLCIINEQNQFDTLGTLLFKRLLCIVFMQI